MGGTIMEDRFIALISCVIAISVAVIVTFAIIGGYHLANRSCNKNRVVMLAQIKACGHDVGCITAVRR